MELRNEQPFSGAASAKRDVPSKAHIFTIKNYEKKSMAHEENPIGEDAREEGNKDMCLTQRADVTVNVYMYESYYNRTRKG